MNPRIVDILTVVCLSGLTIASTLAANETANLELLQGRWSVAKTNQEGQAYSQIIQIKKDQLTFQIIDVQSKPLLVSQGTVKATKAAPFNLLSITDIRAGRTLEEMQPVDDSRALIYILRDNNLFLASNFDKARENEKPSTEIYTRNQVDTERSKAAEIEAKLLGKWKMQVTMGADAYDYELRLAEPGDRLEGTLVSPRSGEHKCRAVQFAKGEVIIEVDREIQGNQVTFIYQANLTTDGLSGKVQVKGHEDQFNGTWKASKE